MGFVNWWKTSSAKASAEHYALRFDERELKDLRGGLLNASAKQKIEKRLQGLKKINGAILLGCGIPMLILMLPFLGLLGFGMWRAAGALSRSPVAWIWLGFVGLVLGFIFVFGVYVALKLRASKQNVAADLQDSRVGIEQGRVDAKIISSKNGFSIHYWMNGTEYEILNDAIGSEIHHHFFGGPNLTGKNSYQTNEFYRFYFLASSKTLLYFERL